MIIIRVVNEINASNIDLDAKIKAEEFPNLLVFIFASFFRQFFWPDPDVLLLSLSLMLDDVMVDFQNND